MGVRGGTGRAARVPRLTQKVPTATTTGEQPVNKAGPHPPKGKQEQTGKVLARIPITRPNEDSWIAEAEARTDKLYRELTKPQLRCLTS